MLYSICNKQIISINKLDVLSHSNIYPSVTSSRDTFIFFMNYYYSLIFFPVLIAYNSCVIS